MLIVRDSRTGKAVSWGTDHHRMNEIAATDPHYVTMPDIAANNYYWYVERQGMGWVHPYDLDAREHAEIV